VTAGFHAHLDVLRRRREWFEALGEAYLALWWVPAGHIPSVAEAEERVAALRERGPTAYAFTFRVHFEPGSDTGGGVEDDRELCPAG
jgi:hypothetical protein